MPFHYSKSIIEQGKKMNILVTGGAGFIGANLIKRLVKPMT